MAAKFVIKKGTSGQFHFNLVAANGETVATSERYTTKEAAIKAYRRRQASSSSRRRRRPDHLRHQPRRPPEPASSAIGTRR